MASIPPDGLPTLEPTSDCRPVPADVSDVAAVVRSQSYTSQPALGPKNHARPRPSSTRLGLVGIETASHLRRIEEYSVAYERLVDAETARWGYLSIGLTNSTIHLYCL